MRDKLIVALLSVCCTLLAVNLLTLWRAPSPAAHGQAGGPSIDAGSYVMATVGTQNEPVIYVLDTAKKRMAAYSARSNGIRVLGVREIVSDFNISEYNKHFTVKSARKLKDSTSK